MSAVESLLNKYRNTQLGILVPASSYLTIREVGTDNNSYINTINDIIIVVDYICSDSNGSNNIYQGTQAMVTMIATFAITVILVTLAVLNIIETYAFTTTMPASV